MSAAQTILGLALGEKGAQVVAIRHEDSRPTLLAIDEWDTTIPLAPGGNGSDIDKFCSQFSHYLDSNNLRPDKVSVTIHSGVAFISTVPFEADISRLERNDQIRWELGQYFPEADAGDFITDVQPIIDNRVEKWVRTLSVSFPKSGAEVIHRVMEKIGLPLHLVDVDHFSADTALRFNYPDSERKFLALLGVKETRLDVSLIRNGVLDSYSYFSISSNNELIEHIRTLSNEEKGLYAMSAYGTYLDMDLLVRIRRASSLLVEALNPLRHVNVSDSLRLADHLTVPSYRFAAAVGVALRQD